MKMKNKEAPHFRKDNGDLIETNMKYCLLRRFCMHTVRPVSLLSVSILSLQSPAWFILFQYIDIS